MNQPQDEARAAQLRQDMEDLHKLGYAQQLFREMGGFSNFAISFSIISILTGAILLFGYGLGYGGPIINTIGWPLVSIFVLIVAASMAELASAYPTAGGLYFWSFKLGGRGWAWITAWFNMIGQIMITAGINFGASYYALGAINKIFGTNIDIAIASSVAGTTNLPTGIGNVVLGMVVLMIPQVLINVFGIKLTALLSKISVYWHIGGVAVIGLVLLFLGTVHQPLSFLFQNAVTTSPADPAVTGSFFIGTTSYPSLMMRVPGVTALYAGGGIVLAFMIGLLQAQWTYTGYDASAHVAEETVMARKNSAWGVFLSVAVSFAVGFILLIVLTLHIPDIAQTAAPPDGSPSVLFIIYQNLTGHVRTAHVLSIIIVGAMWLCGLSSVTSMSRMWFAFARDGGMPGHQLIRQIHPKWRTPVWSIIITSILAILLTVYAALYSVVLAVSTTALYLAYGIPVFLNLRNKLQKKGEYTSPEKAPWSLGKFGVIINAIAIAWIVFITVLFSIPPNELAGWSIIIMALLLFAYWHFDAKRRFKGPKPTSEAELRQIEVQMAGNTAPAAGAADR